jgi:hypothetical protein
MYIFRLPSFCLLPQIKIRDTLHKNYFQVLKDRTDDDLNVHSTICEWGKAIKSDFDTSNAPFKLRHGQPDQAQVAQAFTLLHNLTKEALAAQGSILTQQGQLLIHQDKKIEDLQDTVVEMRTMISELHAERSDMRTMISDLHSALMPRCQGGAHTALLPADLAPGDGPPPSVPAATHIADPQPAPHPAPSSSSRVSTGGKDSTKSLSRTGVKDKAPGFDTHGSLIKVYVTFLRHKWTRAEDAGTWENKHHRSMGAKMYSWVHAIATAEENAILLTGSKTDGRGMTSPNVAKVETNLQKLVIGILYQVHKKYLPGVKIPPGLNYFDKAIEFWGKKIPIVKTTLQNTLDSINKKITDKTALDEYRKTEFLLPSAKLVEQVRQDFTDKKKLQPYTSSGIEDGSPGKKRSREEASAQ